MAFRQQQYVDYSDGVPDKVKQFVVYFYRHIRCVRMRDSGVPKHQKYVS